MADSKVSALAAVTTVDGTDELYLNDGGSSKRMTMTQAQTFIGTALPMAAGSATAGTWPTIGSGTLLTTPVAGTLERDANCIYLTTDDGNRGVVDVTHFIRCDSTRTLPNDTNENAIFNSPTNGTLTLETGTYLFELMIRVNTMSGTSGNALIDILGAGTATAGAWMWFYTGIDAAPATAATFQSAIRVTQDTAASAVTAATATTMGLWARGTFEITGAGTLIPSIDQVTAAAAVVEIGSYFTCQRVGSSSVASVGQWT